MKTEPVVTVVPASLENQGRQAMQTQGDLTAATSGEGAAMEGARIVTAANSAAGGQLEDRTGGMAAASSVARRAGASSAASASGSGSAAGREAAASQQIGLSRMRIESLMLEAQMASATGDVQRARATARAVKAEAAVVRRALTSAIEPGQAAAVAAASEAVREVRDAVRRAAAEDDGPGSGVADQALAPWSRGGATLQDLAAARAAPRGVPTTNLHREAYEALLRAQEILKDLAAVTAAGAALAGEPADGDDGGEADGSDSTLLLSRVEAEDGALLDGWNLLA